ncbi:hypothetical protein COCMIDRAFT_106462 [Bipolaris oryzae ATCC 44560]|uniref:Uncharacterized protein n=1 Tax=Bipolaris oryzae ATCC 44560 TaxID=930090 RepID=W6Z0W6_COCMI|nr:uncharacterized protein COCMIDRAFT_106462 [Bipolaris oryzae ATCC 44560]EUC41309.1 hypothetical protein COCMIDRAFT_106462 [Bipolaris oryzae ATCC 44560]
MASQALVLATNSTLQQKPAPIVPHNSPTQQQQQKPSANKSGGFCLKKGLDSLTEMLERKIDHQILLAKTRAHAASSSQETPAGRDSKHVHWETRSKLQQTAA